MTPGSQPRSVRRRLMMNSGERHGLLRFFSDASQRKTASGGTAEGGGRGRRDG
jgi:hypothetical protein